MKELFAHIAAFFTTLFQNAEKLITDNIDEAVTVAEFINGLLKNPLVQGVLQLAGVKLPETITGRFADILEQALKELVGVQQCSRLTTQEERISCMLKFAQDHLLPTAALRQAFVGKLASAYLRLSAAQDGVTLTNKRADTLVQAKIYEQDLAAQDRDSWPMEGDQAAAQQ